MVNTALYLHSEELSLLTWLIYQCGADNSFKYEEKIVVRYSAAIKAANFLYNPNNPIKLRVDLKAIRAVFVRLIEKSLILKTKESAVFIINPMLTYHPKYVSKVFYLKFAGMYNEGKDICDIYQYHVNKQIKAKRNGTKKI